MRMLRLVLGSFALALLAFAGPDAIGAPIPKGGICPAPDRAKCLTKGYLETSCGREHAKTCKPFIDDALKSYSARPDAVKAKVLSPKGDDIPRDLKDGNYYPYAGPKRGRALSVKGTNALGRSGLSLVPKLGVTAEQAAGHLRNPSWESNGKVTSCAEYAYEKLYDWSRFVDATAGCRGDQGCEVDVAFLPGTPGIARRKLRDKMGGEIGNVQFLDNRKAFMKNDFFAFGKRLVYAGGPSGVAQTPELQQLEAALDAGKQYYSLGCKARCNDRSFGDEWSFHEKMRATTKSVSKEEFDEYERRRAELRHLVALHNAAVQKEVGNPKVDIRERAPELPFDVVTNDPFERYDLMKGFDAKARAFAPNVLKQLGPARLKTLPGAGIETVPVATPVQGAFAPARDDASPIGVLAAPLPGGTGPRLPTKPKPTGVRRPSGLPLSECTKSAFDKAKVEIHEVIGVGPVSCRLGRFLREEWARKAAGQKSCLDLDNRDCDWSPQIFKARFSNSDRFLTESQRAQNECMMWTNDSITDKKDIAAVEAYIVEIKKTISAALIELAPYREAGGTAGQKFGDQLGDAQFEGDKDWFAGGYDYDLRWSVDPIKKTGPAANDPVCDLRGNFRAAAGVDVWLLKNDLSIVDALAQADVNVPNPAKNNERSTHVVSHLTILGKDVYDDVDEYFAMVFEPVIKPAVLFSLPSPKPQWTVMVGPVPITGSAWGELTMGANLRLEGVLKSQTCSADNITFGGIGFFMPWLSIDGRAQVGVGISGLLSAGVRATLNLLTLGIPVDVSLLVNMKKIAGETQAALAFKAAMDLTLGSLSGSVSLYLEFLMFTEEFELFSWNGVGPATIPLMPPLDAELADRGDEVRRVAALVVLLAACAQPPAPPVVAAAPVEATPQRFRAGEVLVYRFEWRVDATATHAAVLPDTVPLGAAIDLAGELAVRVVEADGDLALLAVALRRLDRHEIRLMDANVLVEPAPLLDHEVFVAVGADGDLQRLMFDRDSSSLLRHVMGGVLAHVDLRVAPERTQAWQAVVPAGNGLAEVDYRNDAGALHRALHRYARLDAFAPGLVEPAVEGESTIRHDDRALPLRIDSIELLVVASGSDDPLFDSRTRFSLERIRIEQGEAGGLPAPERLIERDPAAPPDTEEAERELAKRYAGALDLDGVELVVDALANGLLPRRGFMVEATGLLRGWPEQAEALAPMFASTDDRHARSLVVDMLASAGTPEAQRVLIDLLGDTSLRGDPNYPAWLQRLAFLRTPLPEVAGLLLEVHDDACERGLARVRASSLYPLGSVAAALVEHDPLVAELAHRRLLDELAGAGDDDGLRVAALAGLGNEAREDTLDVVLAHVDANDIAVRIQAASSLRELDDERATATLYDQLADPDAGVATTALAALTRHELDAEGSQRLADAARDARHHPELAGPIIAALARRLDDDPAVRDALLAVRERALDGKMRARIDRVLEPPASG